MIRCLIPDMPTAEELLPWLQRIDSQLWYTNNGPLVGEFEQRLQSFIAGAGDAECVTLSSGMSALELGLRALGIDAGKRVLLPALTFPATAQAVVRCGAEPVFADVCPTSWQLTPAIVRDALVHGRIDAVMPVATFGQPLPAPAWDALAQQTGLPVLADAAAALDRQPVGRFTHWAFSMHATKPMGIGEGGLFVSADRALADGVRRQANFSFERHVVHSAHATNAKLSEYGAAVGLAQLQRWPQLFDRRRRVFEAYRRALEALTAVQMQSPCVDPPATLCLRLPVAADPVAAALKADGIETRRWYLPPLTSHPAFVGAQCIGPGGGRELPVTGSLADDLLGVPFHTRLDDADVQRVVGALARQLDFAVAQRTAPNGAVRRD